MRAKTRQPARPCRIDVVHAAGDWPPNGDVSAMATAVVQAVVCDDEVRFPARAHATLVLSDDTSVADLNGRFRGKHNATNVLSFPSGQGGDPGFLGDIVLALETIKREAIDQSVPLVHHMQHLIVHGLLHLIGYDHDTDEAASRMEQLEIRILAQLDVENPYTGALDRGMESETGQFPEPRR